MHGRGRNPIFGFRYVKKSIEVAAGYVSVGFHCSQKDSFPETGIPEPRRPAQSGDIKAEAVLFSKAVVFPAQLNGGRK